MAFVEATPAQSPTTQAEEAAPPQHSTPTRTPYGSVRAAAAAIDASQPVRRPPSPSHTRAAPSASPRSGYQRNSPRCSGSPSTASDGQSTPRQRQRLREEQAHGAALERRAAIARKMQRAEAARDNAVQDRSARARQENRRAQTKSAEIVRSPRPVATPRPTSPSASRPTTAHRNNGTPSSGYADGVRASILEQDTVGGEAMYRVELGVRPFTAAQSEQLRVGAESAMHRVERALRNGSPSRKAPSPQRAASPQKSPQKVWRPTSPQVARARGLSPRWPAAYGGLAAWGANTASRTAEQAAARVATAQLLDRLFAADTKAAPARTAAADPAEPAAAMQPVETKVVAMVAAAKDVGGGGAEKVGVGMEQQTRDLLRAQEEAASVPREAELAATRKAAEESAAAREAALRREAEEAASRAARLEEAQAVKIAELERTLEQQKLAAADPRLFDKGATPAETPPQQRPTRPSMTNGRATPATPAADSAAMPTPSTPPPPGMAAAPEQLEQMVVEAAAAALKQTLDARRQQASSATPPAVEMHVRLSNAGFSVNVQLCPEAEQQSAFTGAG